MKIKYHLTILIFLFGLPMFAQRSAISYGFKITYLKYSNDKKVENQDPIVVFTNQKEILLSSENILSKKNDYPFEQIKIDRSDNFYI